MNDARFQLSNPPPKRKKLDVPNTTGQQKYLISGLSCLEGQLELFSPDGYDTDSHTPLENPETSGKRR